MWLTKTWVSERLKNSIKAEYDIKLESHKALLKAESEVELERLKSSLNILANQKSVTFSQLQIRRAKVVANTYAKLKRLHDSVANYIKPFEMSGDLSREERRNNVIEASHNFTPYYSQNQIFLTKPVAQAVDEVNKELISITNTFIYIIDLAETPDVKQWTIVLEKFERVTKKAVDSLEEQLRELLGDESQNREQSTP